LIEWEREGRALWMTLLMIRSEVKILRAHVIALDWPPHESAPVLAALSLIERRAARLCAETLVRHRGH
jgi:hypothetical protein